MRRNRSSTDEKPFKDGHFPPNLRTPWELLLFSHHSLFITNHVLSSMTLHRCSYVVYFSMGMMETQTQDPSDGKLQDWQRVLCEIQG